MFITTLSIILAIVFIVLSSFHFYWLAGGTWGLESVIPSKSKQASTLRIPKFATLIVALGLAAFALLYLARSGLVNVQFPNWIQYGYWFIPAIFSLRGIGDFNYVGLFKKVKGTKFSDADSKIFVPLCLFIGILGFAIQLYQYA